MIRINSDDARDIVAAATRCGDPSSGVASAAVQPNLRRLAPLLRAILASAGWDALDPGDAQTDARALTVATARLRAAGIDLVVLTQAGWLAPPLASRLVGALEAAGITVAALIHEGWRPGAFDMLDAWTIATTDWRSFARTLADRRGSGAQCGHPCAGPSTLVAAGIPLPVRHVEPGPAPTGPSSARLRDTVMAAASRAEAAEAVVAALTAGEVDPDSGAPAIADILQSRGLRLMASAGPGAACHAQDLRAVRNTAAAAAWALHSAGVGFAELLALGTSDVAADGSRVIAAGSALALPADVRPMVQAQREVRIVEGGVPELLTGVGGHAFDRVSLGRLLAEGARDLGRRADPATAGTECPADVALAGLGLAVEGTPSLAVDLVSDRFALERRCRHGLPALIGPLLSHSQVLCRADEVTDTRRPGAGYTFKQLRGDGGVAVWQIHHEGWVAGTLWHVATPLGAVWVQSMHSPAPAAAAVREEVCTTQARRPFASGHQARHRVYAGRVGA